MRDQATGTNIPTVSRGISPHPMNCDASIVECTSTARQLILALRKESDSLKRFDGKELMELLPHKEFLVNELEMGLRQLRGDGGTKSRQDGGEGLEELKIALKEIDRLNRSNGTFLRHSLDYWRDLMSIFVPPTYGPGREESGNKPLSLKGLAFRREI